MYVDGTFRIAMAGHGSNYSTVTPVNLVPKMANRHGLITGATGTGKTVTLKTIAQSFSDAGVPTFLADVKGDVTGMAVAQEASEKLVNRLAAIGVTNYDFHGCPVRFWDIYGEGGLPVRTTVSEMGPVLLARLMGLTDVQEGVLNIVFHVADDEGMLLLDLKDLRSMLVYVGEHADAYKLTYGNVSSASVGAIQRALLQLEDAGGDLFFGEPALDIADWLKCDVDGKGIVNILDARRLVQSPLIYSTFLLWMLSELYETMPEVGDLDMPRMVFFFDEAHLLFDDAPKALLDKVEQVVKLIRSKGVGVYFITQTPADIPNSVLAQLGNRVQHALRAYTPAEQKVVKAAAASFRPNPYFDTERAIMELETGEALISFLDEKGMPSVVQRAKVIAPTCSMDAAPQDAVDYIMANNPLRTKYENPIDRESAYEILMAAAGVPVSSATVSQVEVEVPATYADDEVVIASYMPDEPLETTTVEAPRPAAPVTNSPIAQAAQAARRERESYAAALAAEKERAKAEAAAEKERLKAEKAAQKEAERQAREYERELERQRKAREKELERQQREYERQLERQRRQLEKEAERARAKQVKEEERRRRQIESIGVSVLRTAATTFTRGLMGNFRR